MQSPASRSARARPGPRLEGGVDRVDPDGTVQGWAWSPDEPKAPRVVVVTLDGHVVGRATCDRPRRELAGKPGAGGFLLRLPAEALHPGAEQEVALRDLASGQQVGAAVRFGGGAAAAPALAPLSGNVDRVTKDGWVSGWCFDPAQPAHRVALEILVDEAVVGTTPAMNWRADLQQAGIGDGAHGFSYALPYDVLARKGTLRVRVRESGTGRPLGQPALLRIGRLADGEQRMAELERQVRQMRGRMDQLLREAEARPAVEERSARALFATVAGFFQDLADGTVPDARGFGVGSGLRATLDDLTARLPGLVLHSPVLPEVLLIVPAVAPVERVHRCLAAAQAAGADRIADVLVLDPGADDRTALLPGLVPGLRYRRCPADGLVAACAEAIAAAGVPYAALLDPHVEVLPETVPELLATLRREPAAAVVGAAVRRPDGLLHHAGYALAAGGTLADSGRHAEADESCQRFLRPVGAVDALACAIDRARLRQAGGLDAGYSRLGHAMVAACARLRSGGSEVLVQPASRGLWAGGDAAATDSDLPDVTGTGEDASRLRLALLEAEEAGAGDAQGFVGRALVVDDAMPRPDRDAGSIAVLEQMQVLRRLGWRVTFAPASGAPVVAADRARLERLGIEAAVPPEHPSVTRYLQDHGAALDLAMLVRHANAGAIGPRVRELAPAAKLLFAPADLHFLREAREAALAGRRRETPAAKRTRAQELACVAAADATLLLSDHERDLLAQWADPARLHVLRWIAVPAPPGPDFAARDGLLFVGNFAHRPNVDAVLWYAEAIRPALERLRPGLTLHVVGSDPPREIAALDGPGMRVHGWVADLDAMLDRARLSVAPLRYGAGFKGKVAVSLARGVPVVGTGIAFEGTGLVDGEGVAVADQPGAFAAALAALHDDRAAWDRASRRAREQVSALYSPAGAETIMRRVLAGMGLPYRPARGSDPAAADDGVVNP